MSWIDDLFGGGREGAAKDMYNQMRQGWGASQGYLNPFIQRGNTAYNAYTNALNQGQDPYALYQQFASKYQMSPEAKAQIAQGIKAASNAAAASGMLGSGAEQTAASNLSQSVRSKDFDKYMQDMFGIRGQYLSGQFGLEQQGYGAATTASQEAEQYYEAMAKAKAAQDEARAQGESGAIGAGVGILGDFAGGGMFGSGVQDFWNKYF